MGKKEEQQEKMKKARARRKKDGPWRKKEEQFVGEEAGKVHQSKKKLAKRKRSENYLEDSLLMNCYWLYKQLWMILALILNVFCAVVKSVEHGATVRCREETGEVTFIFVMFVVQNQVIFMGHQNGLKNHHEHI